MVMRWAGEPYEIAKIWTNTCNFISSNLINIYRDFMILPIIPCQSGDVHSTWCSVCVTCQPQLCLEHLLTWDTGRWVSHSPQGSTLGPAWAPRASSGSGLLSPSPVALSQPDLWALEGQVSQAPPRDLAPSSHQDVLRLLVCFSSFWPSVG